MTKPTGQPRGRRAWVAPADRRLPTGIGLPRRLIEALDAEAVRRGTSRSEVAIEAVEVWLRTRSNP